MRSQGLEREKQRSAGERQTREQAWPRDQGGGCAAELALPDMTKGQARKLTTVIDTINKLATQIAPVDESIVRQVRRTADRLFCRSVEHSRCCGKSACHRSLFDKPARVIACKSFVYTIEKAANGDGIDGVSKQTLTVRSSSRSTALTFSTRRTTPRKA
eukprot:6258241-Prymnesium_polylepis.1